MAMPTIQKVGPIAGFGFNGHGVLQVDLVASYRLTLSI